MLKIIAHLALFDTALLNLISFVRQNEKDKIFTAAKDGIDAIDPI